MSSLQWQRTAILAATLTACGIVTDPATRLAADLEGGADRLPLREGATDAVHHATPSRPGQCEGPYKVQLDRVGAMIVWCYDSAVDTSQTFIVDKGSDETLIVDLERRGGRAVITALR